MSDVTFPVNDNGRAHPTHCGQTLEFSYPTCFCSICKAEFPTQEMVEGIWKAEGREKSDALSPAVVALASALTMLVTGRG